MDGESGHDSLLQNNYGNHPQLYMNFLPGSGLGRGTDASLWMQEDCTRSTKGKGNWQLVVSINRLLNHKECERAKGLRRKRSEPERCFM